MKWNLKNRSSKESEQALQELKILEEDIAAVKDFLRRNSQTYFQNKKKLPIYLILGPARFGKTTLLSRAGLDLIDTELQNLTTITPTKYCSFWFSKDSLYIDTAGTYTKPDITRPRNDLIWKGFIKLLQKYFGKNSIAGTLIVLDLPTITEDKSLLRKALFCIRERIYEMAALINNLHTHIIFTKCDRIAGFTEFFSMLSQEERLQPFGISFNNVNKKLGLVLAFEEKFNELLKHLNNRIVENLQKSTLPEERPLIKIFPSQIEYLRQILIETISKIPHSRQILLSGIYFTSSIQSGQPLDLIKTAASRALNLQKKALYNLEANNNHSYFIEELFKKTIIIPEEQRHTSSNITWLQIDHWYAMLVTSSIISISCILGYQSYLKNIEAINQTKISLTTQNISDPNSLTTIINQLKQNSTSWWLTFGINKITSLQFFLLKTHKELLIQNLGSQLESYLVTINTQEPQNIHKLYDALQAYLMLATPNKLDPNYIKNWFSEHIQEIYSNNEQKNYLQSQLALIYQYKYKIRSNSLLIKSIRENLNNSYPKQLIYFLLEKNFTKKHLDINTTKIISSMYLRENFHHIYNGVIPQLVTHSLKHDWVLGDSEIKAAVDQNMVKNIQDMYVEKYVAEWKGAIYSETKIGLKNWDEVTKYLSTVNSPFINILKQLKYNISIDNPPPKLIQEIQTEMPGLSNLNLENLQEHLNELTHYMNTMVQNSHGNKTALATLVQYLQPNSTTNPLTTFKNFADTQPPWIQSYLQSISNNVWQILVDAAYDYISQEWDQTIMPTYKATLANKYPLFKTSKEDIKLEDFNVFFAPNGLMDGFFNQYIKPLANIDKADWTWKEIKGQKISYPSTFLEIFLRAALIQKMFYATKTPVPKLEFALTPIIMTPNTQSFTLHVDGQKISFANEESRIKHLVWPGPQSGTVTMSFVNNQGKYFTFSEFGPWAWFRILDKFNLTPNNNTKYFELTFELNGNAIKYSLSTKEPVNPFIPEIVDNFRCTEQSS